MSAGEIAGLIAALAFVVLVGLLALPILRLTSTLEEARRSIERLTEETVPTLRGTATTVDNVNATLVHAAGITSNVESVATNTSALSALFTSIIAGPAVKLSAFSYGVRRAVSSRGAAAGTRRAATPLTAGGTRRRTGRDGASAGGAA